MRIFPLHRWRRVEPGFDLAVAQQVEAPSASGWDSAGQVIYRTPSAEGRLAMALVRVLNGRAYDLDERRLFDAARL